jgi:8-oxo-dGTP pyrophosphatase MutT (NUDIX family)
MNQYKTDDANEMTNNSTFPLSNLFIVSAVIYTTDGRYLMQLRDDKPGLALRNHWAFFGGEVDPGEAPEDAILREVEEELTFRPNNCCWFHEAVYILPLHGRNVVRKAYYLIAIKPEEVDSMVLCEGADLKLMTVSEILTLNRVAPWDLSVVLLHSREEVIYQP